MVQEIHEALGVVSAWALGLTAVVGVAAFVYASIKGRLKVRRQTLVRAHGLLSLTLLVFLVAHVLTTDRLGAIVVLGAVLVLATLLIGVSFRVSRRHFRPAIRAKAALVVAAAILLVVGHAVLEREKEAERHGEARVTAPER